jgi:hypothetical protein
MKKSFSYSQAEWLKFSRFSLFLISLIGFLSVVNGQTFQQVHDPSNPVYSGGKWWIHTTGSGIYRMSKSTLDPLVGWTSGSKVFPTTPSWIKNYVPGFAGDFWAPHLSGSEVYYSCSTWGSKVSCIGKASGTPGGTYTDKGLVIYSNNSTTQGNAIDPFVFNGYLIYGSYFEGIWICSLSNLNSRTRIKSGNVEAGAMTNSGGYYYLWYNAGSCCQGCNSTYYVRVARSTSITGPFSGDRTILSTSGRYIGPGCIGFSSTSGGTAVWHFYDKNDGCNPRLMTGTVSYSGGWPVISKAYKAAEEPNEAPSVELCNYIDVYPNPIEDMFTVSFNSPSDATLNITNISGQILSRVDFKAGNNTVTFSASDLKMQEPGLYILLITNREGAFAFVRLMKE